MSVFQVPIKIKLSDRQLEAADAILHIHPAEYARRAAAMVADGRMTAHFRPSLEGDYYLIKESHDCYRYPHSVTP